MNYVDTPQTHCRAGVARCDITPPIGIYHRMWGAATHDRAVSVHRPLTATALWLASPATHDDAVLLVTLDHCVLDGAEMTRLREAICQGTAISPAQVQIALSHTHGSGWMSRSRAEFPGGELIAPYLDGVAKKLAAIAVEAERSAQPATVLYGKGRCSLAAQRDFFDADSNQFVCGFNPAGTADDTVLVGQVWTWHTNGKDRSLAATMVNYACHPTTLAWENTAISPDYVGAMRETVESATNAPCIFLQGASGDLGPREGFVGDPAIADKNGRQLGYAVLSALESLPPPRTRFVYSGPVVSGATLGTWRHEAISEEVLELTSTWVIGRFQVDLPYRTDLPPFEETKSALEHWSSEEANAHRLGDAVKARDCRAMVERITRRLHRLNTLPSGRAFPYVVTLGRLGDAIWLFLPGEFYQTAQVELRRRFPDHPIIVATLTGDWQPGYLPAKSAYGHGIYQETIACVSAGALEVLIDAIAGEIHKAMGDAPPVAR